MARYTPEQVMAAVHALARETRPYRRRLAPSTGDIAREVRKTAGADIWRSGTSDVTPALAELVAAGKLVTYKRATSPARRQASGENEAYAHIAPSGNYSERFYATPANADIIRQAVAAAVAARARADEATDLLGPALRQAGMPGDEVDVRQHDALVVARLTAEQAQWLIARLDPAGRATDG